MNLHSIAIALTYWRTADGQRLHVSEMTDDHIINIVRMFGRTPRTSRFVGVERAQMLAAVVAEGDRRGIIRGMGASG